MLAVSSAIVSSTMYILSLPGQTSGITKEQVTKHMKKESFKQADVYYTSKEKSLLPLTKETLEYAVSINQVMLDYSNHKPIDIIFFLMKNRWRLIPVYWMLSAFILSGSS